MGGGGGPRRGAALPCPARAAALRAAAAGRDAADHGPKPGPGCCSSVQQLRAAPLRAGAAALPLQLVALARALAAGPPGPAMRITGVMRVQQPLHGNCAAIAHNRSHVIRRVRAGCVGSSLPDLVALGCFRQQQPGRCSAGAHGAQAAQPAAGSRCSCGAGGHGARTAAGPLSECGPGLHGGRAAGDDRAETPGTAAAAAVERGRGAGAASASGGAVGASKG